VPDGRGYLGGFWVLPGPWLRPGFHQKGYRDQEQNRRHMKTLIDRFNAMLERLSAASTFGHVHYLNLRGTLGADPYRDYWENELHPTKRGFRLVTQRFVELIAKVRV
jgi:hypothetical protein